MPKSKDEWLEFKIEPDEIGEEHVSIGHGPNVSVWSISSRGGMPWEMQKVVFLWDDDGDGEDAMLVITKLMPDPSSAGTISIAELSPAMVRRLVEAHPDVVFVNNLPSDYVAEINAELN